MSFAHASETVSGPSIGGTEGDWALTAPPATTNAVVSESAPSARRGR